TAPRRHVLLHAQVNVKKEVSVPVQLGQNGINRISEGPALDYLALRVDPRDQICVSGKTEVINDHVTSQRNRTVRPGAAGHAPAYRLVFLLPCRARPTVCTRWRSWGLLF